VRLFLFYATTLPELAEIVDSVQVLVGEQAR